MRSTQRRSPTPASPRTTFIDRRRAEASRGVATSGEGGGGIAGDGDENDPTGERRRRKLSPPLFSGYLSITKTEVNMPTLGSSESSNFSASLQLVFTRFMLLRPFYFDESIQDAAFNSAPHSWSTMNFNINL